jgi:hypothetical protein
VLTFWIIEEHNIVELIEALLKNLSQCHFGQAAPISAAQNVMHIRG